MNLSNDSYALWKDIYQLGLISKKEVIDDEAFLAVIEQDPVKLQQLLLQCEDSEYIETMSLDDLIRIPYKKAQEIISRFSFQKRIDILSLLGKKKDYYYEQTRCYGSVEEVNKEDIISAKEFYSLLNRIKHLEILETWLYGIE